jgi:hypothetical protein
VTDGIQIERSNHAQEFVIIGNTEARDCRLSFRARGLHHHLLSLPSGWRVTTADLAKDHPEGREAIRTALNELIEFGYVTKAKRQDEHGRWSTALTVHDKPQDSVASGADSTEDGFPGVGQPDFGELGAKQKTVTKDGKDGPVDMASRRARAKAASAQLTVADAINAVRRAVTIEHTAAEADDLTDAEALGLYFTYVGNRRPRDLVAYLGKILGDSPSIDAFLSNSSAACPQCCHWETDCQCPAA